MWSAIRWIVLRLIALRWFFKLGWLGALIPIAMILKVIGLPLLAILSVVALPILALLLLFGLPIFLVLAVGGLFMGAIACLLLLSVVALKLAIFVVLPIWLVWMVVSKVFSICSRGRGNDPGTPGPASDTPRGTAPDTAPGASTDSMDGMDPA